MSTFFDQVGLGPIGPGNKGALSHMVLAGGYMRYALLTVVGLMFWCGMANAGERYAGFLTLGCGDRYIKVREMPQTWYVDLSAEQERELFQLARVDRDPIHYPWSTLHVALEATRRPTARRGYFGMHPQQLEVERVISARYPAPGETVEAATAPAQSLHGFLIVSIHGSGFVPLSQSDEIWWVVDGAARLDAIENTLVEIVGRVGPPGAYGAMNDYNREIAIDEFRLIRSVDVAEMSGTAAIQGDVNSGINMCKPQAR